MNVYGHHMSRYHEATRHGAKARRLRPIVAAMLPAPCVECGRLVDVVDAWQIAHLTPAALGGDTRIDNVGPAHRHCNASAGAQLGNAIHRRTRHASEGIRPW